ncbi:MAG: M67 family metallopeptidase [Holophagales bacterium]|nr:M67 family metallopeptidase [Holophagales bacterium]
MTSGPRAPGPHCPTPDLRVDEADLERLRCAADAAFPFEVCGLLVGRDTEEARWVEEVTLALNLAGADARHRYVLDPEDFLATERRARISGRRVVGIWHSHPGGTAIPSQLDLELAWREHSQLILAIDTLGSCEMRSWVLRRGRFVAQPISRLGLLPGS